MKRPVFFSAAALRFVAFTLLVSILSLSVSVAADGRSEPVLALLAVKNAEPAERTVIIDAGHGGFDGGATAIYGGETVVEKDLNLSVAKRLCALFGAAGIPCVMTRDNDVMLGKGKAEDLKNRLELAKSFRSPVFISIHQNKFPEGSCKGLQVYYSKNSDESETLALFVQNVAKMYLDGGNDRKIKRADSSIYLLDRLKCPAVLVECGFLSNAEECEKLQDDGYQKQLAAVIFAAVAEFCGQDLESKE